MKPQDANFKLVCFRCIGDHVLSDKVKAEGASVYCDYCGNRRAAKNLEWVANRIDEVVQQHFELTPGYPVDPFELFLASKGDWERRGESVEYLIAEIASLEERSAHDLTDILSNRQSYEAGKYGEENPYGPEAMYEEREPFDLGFRLTWTEFRREIQSRSRFFSAGVEEMLADIFGDLTVLKTSGERPVIREINPQDQNHFVWRGRIAQSPQEIETILKSPAQELGPPPSRSAKARRMNAQGISVFYGATKQSTCVSELRPLVGNSIVIGRFELLSPARLLDLGALSEVYVHSSYFDPEYAVHKARAVPQGTVLCTKAVSADNYPQDWSYDPATQVLAVGEGECAPVSPEVWNYSLSGFQIVRSWLDRRKLNRSGQQSSPLDEIRPERWAFTEELLELLWVIEATLAMQPEGSELLARVYASDLFSEDEFLKPSNDERRPPNNTVGMQATQTP